MLFHSPGFLTRVMQSPSFQKSVSHCSDAADAVMSAAAAAAVAAESAAAYTG